jgi:hypothetical protein
MNNLTQQMLVAEIDQVADWRQRKFTRRPQNRLHRTAGMMLRMAAVAVGELPPGHSLFAALDAAQEAGGEFWMVRRSDFLRSFGYGPAAEGFAYILIEKLESLATRFVAAAEHGELMNGSGAWT